MDRYGWTILLLLWLVAPLGAQSCATVSELVDLLQTDEAAGNRRLSRLTADCPTAADTLSLVYHQLSVGAFSNGGLIAAARWAEKALPVQEALYADSLALPLAKTRANLGLFYRELADYPRALPHLLAADDNFAELNIWSRRHNNREQLVYLHHATGELGRSAALLNLMDAAVPAGDEYKKVLARAEIARLRGVQAVQEKRYGMARKHLTYAAATFDELGAVASWLTSTMEKARASYYLKDYPAARRQLAEVQQLIDDYELHYDGAVVGNLALLVATAQADFPAAERAYDAGRAHALADGNPRLLPLLELSRAELAAAANDRPAALRYARSALALLTPGYAYSDETVVPTPDQLATSPYKSDLFETLTTYAELLHQLHLRRPDPALAAETRAVIGAGDAVADLLRADLNDQVSKLFWRETALPLYALGARLAAVDDDPERVLYYLEKSRSLLLLDELRTTAVLATVPPALRGELAARQDSLTAALAAQLSEPTAAGAETIRAARLAVDASRRQLADQVPALRNVVARPRMVDLPRARATLADGGWDRQLQFLSTADSVYVFSLTATAARWTALAPQTEVRDALRPLLPYFGNRTAAEKAPADYLVAAHATYRLLLEPLNLPVGERLLILPDAQLGYLPFAALVTEPGQTDLESAAYLIRRHAVSYGVSATALAEQANGRADGEGTVLTFAPFTEDFPGRTASLLPASSAEVEAVATAYGGVALTGTAADRPTLLDRLAKCRLAHLSTHAFPNDGELPPRVLTAGAPVYLSDVYGLALDTELVTLSACQSNVGRAARGEGVLGLGRAFTAAGAGGVVASLWNLNDRSTAGIITDFYDELAAGATKPEALHRAQLVYLDRTDLPGYLKSPYYWAGLTYYGNAAGVEAGGFSGWGYGLLAGGLLLLLVLTGRRLLR